MKKYLKVSVCCFSLFLIALACTKEVGLITEVESFELEGQTDVDIDDTTSTITVTVPDGTNLNTAPSVLNISPNATVTPVIGDIQDFSGAVTYTVTAENGDPQEWMVNVTVLPPSGSGANAITGFALPIQNSADIDTANNTITVNVPDGADLNVAPQLLEVSPGATFSPAIDDVQDFDSQVIYSVTAENGTQQLWTVNVTVSAPTESDQNAITAFGLTGQTDVDIDGTTNTVTVTVPNGTNLNTAPSVLNISPNAMVTPAIGDIQDFSQPVVYTVTAENGDPRLWTVSVTVTSSSEKSIDSFIINGVPGTFNGTDISLTLPSGTNVTALSPVIEFFGQSVAPSPGAPTDFTNDVVYTVTAEDNSTLDYTVTVNLEIDTRSSKNDITQFTLSPTSGNATLDDVNHTATITVPFGTDLLVAPTNLVVSTGATVSPLGNVERDFSNPVNYTVTAENGDSQVWQVIANVEADTRSSENDITQFTLSPTSGNATLDDVNHTATITVPFGTDLLVAPTNLVVSTGATVSPLGNVERDFSNPVNYTVTAENGDSQVWQVIANVEADTRSSENDITQFTLSPTSGNATLDDVNHTATITVPFGTDLLVAPTNLVVSTGATVSPLGNVERDFSNPVNYTVTAENGDSQVWQVIANVEADTRSSENDITQFTLSPTSGNATLDDVNHTATITVPFGTDLLVAPTNLVVSTGATVSPLGNVERDFSNPVNYTVTAENGDSQVWQVIVNVEADTRSSENDITQFTLSPTSGNAALDDVNHTATITVPFGTDLLVAPTNLVVSTGATVSPLGNVERDFSNPANYTVTAENGDSQVWQVIVNVEADTRSSENDITRFTLSPTSGDAILDNVNHTATITVPFGTDLLVAPTNLVVSTGATVSPLGNVERDFSNPVNYTVTAENGNVQNWILTVNPITIDVTGINVTPATSTVTIGNNIDLVANVVPANASNTGVTWSSSNPAIAMVSTTGAVTGVSPGAVAITATADDDSGTAGTAIVTVNGIITFNRSTGRYTAPAGSVVEVGMLTYIDGKGVASLRVTTESGNQGISLLTLGYSFNLSSVNAFDNGFFTMPANGEVYFSGLHSDIDQDRFSTTEITIFNNQGRTEVINMDTSTPIQ
ncbi:Ig-like domain-containing protein [Zobellia roscoffensis]|uniref:Ig-like domain-containing protein n=1 Tax=Zobellia roscoffensis TaxID=2779508 RepID=UPI00188DA1EC|nr:Ig-like domain-containing protein [Zobellia roscoffensis]